MTHTRRKLDEAKFFLQLADESRHIPNFNFYLSACVSAARSVTWIMRSEYSRSEGWQHWFVTKEPTPKEQELLRKVNQVRIRSEKQRPLEANVMLEVNIPPERVTEELKARMQTWPVGTRVSLALVGISEQGELTLPEGYPEDAIVGTTGGFELRLAEFPGEDIIGALRRYIALLDELVGECEQLHAP